MNLNATQPYPSSTMTPNNNLSHTENASVTHPTITATIAMMMTPTTTLVCFINLVKSVIYKFSVLSAWFWHWHMFLDESWFLDLWNYQKYLGRDNATNFCQKQQHDGRTNQPILFLWGEHLHKSTINTFNMLV